MKIELNLAHAESPLERYLWSWSVPAIVFGTLFLIHSLVSAAHSLAEWRAVQRSVGQYQGQIAILRERETRALGALNQPAFRNLRSEAELINSLIDQRQVSLAEITLELTKLLPDQARLSGLSISQAGNEPQVLIKVEGKTEDAVYTFLENLEQSPKFQQPLVSHQAFEKGLTNGDAVELTCTAFYKVNRRPEKGD